MKQLERIARLELDTGMGVVVGAPALDEAAEKTVEHLKRFASPEYRTRECWACGQAFYPGWGCTKGWAVVLCPACLKKARATLHP